MSDLPPPGLPAHLDKTPIRMIVADIDGCLSAGSGAYFDQELIRKISWANDTSRTDITVPCVTLCTGRPQPYVECLLQTLHGYQPALCESGTVFFDPRTHSILTHPEFGSAEKTALNELRHQVNLRLGKPNVKPEPGKVTHITLIIQQPDTPEAQFDEALEIAEQFGDMFYLEMSRMCIHFLFRRLHKGVGLHWLSKESGIPVQEMAGIGDAAPDLPFLKQVGFAYAPANAHRDVKAACHRVSGQADAGAAMELLDITVAHNRRLQEEGLLKQQEVVAG